MMLNRIRKSEKRQWLLPGLLLWCLLALAPGLMLAAGDSKAADDAVSAAVVTDVQAFDEGLPRTGGGSRSGLKPYGANLFEGNYSVRKTTELDPNYRVQAGDRISIRLWGATTLNEVMTVDANGDIFVPDVGEIRMLGVRSADVSSRIKVEVGKVYNDAVDVYASLLSATPTDVSVFVTGQVMKPGQYLGQPDDSLLAYLNQAGGVDPQRGSYRHVMVKRGDARIASVDLYDFINNGNLPRIRFQNGDTIVVRPQGNRVDVEGAARNGYRFEFLSAVLTGSQLVRYARPDSSVTHVALSGTREGLPTSRYLSYEQFLRTRLLDGDVVRFVTDAPSDVMDIRVEGSHLGNAYYAVRRGSRLQEILDYIAVNPNEADIANVYIRRKSVAQQQKRQIDEALRRLERSVLTAPASSDGEATIRAREAELVLQFVQRAEKVQPEGRVVVSERGQVANVRLEDGDVIVIPQKSDVITISGEVQVPQAVVYARNAGVLDYIAQAGGFTDRANRERLVLVKPNGKVLMGGSLYVEPGDQVVVYPAIDTKNVQATKDIVQIIYQIAVAARAVGL
ncbi:MAG TPA: SLBB domain-containing protein [Thiolinea sp.]|nr:SLBB domain-containing protein [Thiolinea sp.]